MAGRLGKNLRQGHKAEDLGIMFLRNFCAVAQLRQEDDIGIDAVATLLREEKGLLYAENTFFAQIKSKSVSEILYEGNELDWLINQDLPLFIISIDKEEDDIKIYTTNPAYQIITFRAYNKLKLALTTTNQKFFKRHEIDGDVFSVDIGPPIIESSYDSSKTTEEQQRLYMSMKKWVEEEHKQTQMRKLGFSMLAKWATEEDPDYYAKIVNGNTANIIRDLMAAKPFVGYLSNHLEWNGETEEYKKDVMRGLKKWYKEYDIDVSLNVDKNILHKDDDKEIYT